MGPSELIHRLEHRVAALKETLADRDREIARLQASLTSAQKTIISLKQKRWYQFWQLKSSE